MKVTRELAEALRDIAASATIAEYETAVARYDAEAARLRAGTRPGPLA